MVSAWEITDQNPLMAFVSIRFGYKLITAKLIHFTENL